MSLSYRVRLDPWEPDYEGANQLPESDEPLPDIDVHIELATWGAVQPTAATPPDRIFFVDGVRRIEHRIFVEAEDRIHFGLLGSFAAGAVCVGRRAKITDAVVRRVASMGGGLDLPSWQFPLAVGNTHLSFDALTIAENSPEAALLGLQNSMREHEAALAEQLSTDQSLVFLDGTLTFFTASKRPVVGFVKRLMRSYLPPDQALLLRSLAVGQRTPVFLIKETRHQRYSWYARLASGRVIDSTLTGIVRLETSSSLDLNVVRNLADVSAAVLPRFASAFGRDPRAPQNLYPIGGLETFLRHRMGDTLVIRRAIEAYLHAQEVAA